MLKFSRPSGKDKKIIFVVNKWRRWTVDFDNEGRIDGIGVAPASGGIAGYSQTSRIRQTNGDIVIKPIETHQVRPAEPGYQTATSSLRNQGETK